MTTPTKDELVDAITAATRTAFTELIREHPDETFYYCSLTTTGEGHPPELCAWSAEALKRAADGDPEEEAELKWSYADSPYYGAGESHFAPVRRLFALRPLDDDDDDAFDAEVDLRLEAMEEAMARLDAEGLFGRGAARDGIVINAEIMPPEYENTERAKRLNPPAAIRDWLVEAGEDPP